MAQHLEISPDKKQDTGRSSLMLNPTRGSDTLALSRIGNEDAPNGGSTCKAS